MTSSGPTWEAHIMGLVRFVQAHMDKAWLKFHPLQSFYDREMDHWEKVKSIAKSNFQETWRWKSGVPLASKCSQLNLKIFANLKEAKDEMWHMEEATGIYLASTNFWLGLLVPGPAGLHLIVYISCTRFISQHYFFYSVSTRFATPL